MAQLDGLSIANQKQILVVLAIFCHLAKSVAVGQGEMRFGSNETTSNLSVVHIIISLISANVRNAFLKDLVAENGSTNHSNQDMSLLSP